MRDFDRPLEPSGIDDAEALGERMRSEGWTPALVLCSTAARAKQTWECVAGKLGGNSEVRWMPSLYETDAAGYLKSVRQAGDVASVMLVGHNPMIEDTALLLGDRAGSIASKLRRKGFPTAGLATFTFDGPIADLKPHKSADVGLITPDDL